MKKLLLIFLVTMLPKVVNANPDKVCINGLYFDCFNYYGANTCRFTADFNGVASSTYTGRIEIPSTITYQNVTYTVRKIGANVFYNSGVTYVYLPNTITQFDGLAFEGATNLKYIVSAIEDPQPSNGDNYPYADYIFGYSGINESCILVVPQGKKSTYTTKNWAKNVKGGVYENAYFKLDNKTRSYGNANPTLTYSYATLENIISEPTYSCNATNTSPVGNYQISFDNKVGVVASGVATFVDGTLTVTKAPLTITAKSYTIKQGEALPSFEATYSGFKNGQTSSVLTTQPAFNCSATSSSAPGTYDITVSGAAAQNYSFNYVKGTLTITDADPVTVTATSYSRQYGNANPAFGYTSSGAVLSGTPSITCSATATSPVGNYAIVASQGTVTNYNVTYVNGTLTITKAPLTITAKSYTIKQGKALPAFEAEYSGFKNSETSSVLTTQPTFNCSATSSSAPGTYDIIVSGAAAQNYSFNYVNGTLTIEANVNIQFADNTVKSICVENWDTNGDGELSEDEAAAVTDLGVVFRYNKSITSFDELQYFTGLTSIGYQTFYFCEGLTSVTIPNGVTSIGYGAFGGCSSLSTVSIPNSVTSIGDYAFHFCSGLSSITIPNSVTSIGDGVFASCPGLTSIIVDTNNPNYDSREECNAIIETATNKLVSGCNTTVIPNSVISIGDSAFEGSGLTSVTIPNNVTSIGNSAFRYCDSLTSLTIGSGVTSIGEGAFTTCNALTSVTIPNNVTSIGNGAFQNCYGLTSITIGSGVTSISQNVFRNCTGLLSVTIPNSVTNIGSSAFSNCTGLLSVTIPNSVTSIGSRAFEACTDLTSIIIPNSVTNIDYGAFKDSGLTSVTIPNSVTTISQEVFRGCSGLTSVTIPNSVTSLGDYSFSGCSGLLSVTIPNSVTSIGQYAFDGCSSLTSITIPNSVISIGGHAFKNCSGLTSLTIGTGLTSIYGYVFSGCSSLTSIIVDTNNPTYDSREDCNAIIHTATNSLVTGSSGTVIPNSVTSIDPYAFGGCTGLTSIIIPNSVTSIGMCAFDACTNLTSIIIPNSVTSFGNAAFKGCTGLTSVTITYGVTSIGAAAFNGCSGLTYVTIPSSVTSIGNSAFRSCSVTSVKTYNNTPIGIGGVGEVFDTSWKTMTLYVPRGSKAAYQTANGWKNFYSIVEFDIIQGDANGDGEVNVSDIVEIVNFIMNKPCILFAFETADINEDGLMNVTDIVGVASSIMSTSNNAPKRSSVFEMVDNDQLEMTSSDNQTLSINLQNEGNYVASQFDIVLSAGQTLESIQLNSKRMNNHLIAYAKIADNRYKVVIYSLDNATYKGHSGELLNIKVAGSGDVSVEDILFVTAAKTEKRFPPLHRGATGISVITKPTGKMDIYSIDGRLVRKQAESTDGLKKGLYIINGKKQIIR